MKQVERDIHSNIRMRPKSPCCRSGKCASCIEEARWERLFRQKFADAHYYSRRQSLWSVSPLAEVLPGRVKREYAGNARPS
jgi:hypothetical protein